MTQLKDNRDQPIKVGDRVIYVSPSYGLKICRISKIKTEDSWNSVYRETRTHTVIRLEECDGKSWSKEFWCRSGRNITLINSDLIDFLKN